MAISQFEERRQIEKGEERKKRETSSERQRLGWRRGHERRKGDARRGDKK